MPDFSKINLLKEILIFSNFFFHCYNYNTGISMVQNVNVRQRSRTFAYFWAFERSVVKQGEKYYYLERD